MPNMLTAEYGLDGQQDIDPSHRSIIATLVQAKAYNVLATLGDSRIEQGFVNGVQYYANGVISHLRALMKGNLRVAYSGGVSGNRTDQMLARLNNAINSGAGILFIWGGVNDIAQSFPTATTSGVTAFNNIKLMAETARLAGIVPIVTTETPVTSGWNATQYAQLYELNARLANYVQTTTGVQLLDMHAQVVDFTSATPGTVKSGVYTDATHVNNLGAYLGGVALYSILTNFVPPGIRRKRAGLQDEYANNPYEVLTNGNFMTTSGGIGSGSNGVTGTIPGSWTVTRIGSAAATAVSTVTASDGFGKACQLAITGAASGDEIRMLQDVTLGRLTSGETYRATCDVKISGNTNLEGVYLYFEFNNGVSTTRYDMYCNALGGGYPDSSTLNLTLQPVDLVTSGTLAWLTVRGYVRFNGAAGAATVEFSNFSCTKVPK